MKRQHDPLNPRRGASRLAVALLASTLLVLACGPIESDEPGAPATGAPVASFSQDATEGSPGLVVQFTDTSTGHVTSREWDFGPLGTRSEPSPSVQFPAIGTYPVKLTVSGPGGASTIDKPTLISVFPGVTAGFACTPTLGFVPLNVVCTDSSTNATSWFWDFGDGGTSTQQNPLYEYTAPGLFVVEQTASGGGGSQTASLGIDARRLGIVAQPQTGAAPLDVAFAADTQGLPAGFWAWEIDGALVGMESTLDYRFLAPGTYSVALTTVSLNPPLVGKRTIEVVVDFGPPLADFDANVVGGMGPFAAVFQDRSAGLIDAWDWEFGDGSRCIYPREAVPEPPQDEDPIPTCSGSSPTHTYTEVGAYDVKLTVTGPGSASGGGSVTSTLTRPDHARVYLVDPSFEEQQPNTAIGGGWESLRPANELEPATHDALSNTGGGDIGMPAEGRQWAALDGLGTDGQTDVDQIENGIRQILLHPPGQPVLELDFTLLYAEPPASQILDAVVATVSDGATTVAIPSSRADTTSPYAGESQRFPQRDGGVVRSTPRLTAGIDLQDAFPGSNDLTRFTLTIRTGNAVSERRSPRVFVDNLRFSEPVDALPVAFEIASEPVFVGEAARFIDITCPNPDDTTCPTPTSWRWDFDTQDLVTPPAASGSGEQNPTYVFAERGVYDVRLVARRANAEGTATRQIEVVGRPVASFETLGEGPWQAPAEIEFRDTSTSDPLDDIVAWSWDFGGWGTSSLQNPAPVSFPSTGTFTITLTVTTRLGETARAETQIELQ